jgi:tungstate ABC transporter binding protein WtpA
MVPFQAIEKEFETQHPNVDVLIEGHGSIQVIRHVTEVAAIAGEPAADVVAVADYSLIPKMMYNTQMPDTAENYADWCVKFATNSLGIAYTSQSKYADEINGTNWYHILSKPDVKVGMSDPRFDACGYRALMLCQLAELFYHDETIFEGILGDFSYPIKISENDNVYTISVPEILEPEKIAIRDSSVKLLFPLKSGDIDYAFEYKSVAEQHGMEFLELPPQINLESDGYKTLCNGIKVKLAFKRFASVTPEFECQPIIYGVTIPKNAPHPELALEFVKFIISSQGQEILRQENQPPIVPAEADNLDKLPGKLRPFVK